MIKKFNFVSAIRSYLPRSKEIERVVRSLSPFEKTLFFFLTIAFILSSLVLLSKVNNFILVEIEAKGGSFTEGIVGSPRFINPILALSDADRDMSSLVYSGLLKADPDSGLVEDLTEGYTVSEDGLSYDFTIREDSVFHDGAKVTADDVVFTVLKAQDPVIKSPRLASWDGVKVEAVDERHVRFILPRPYAPFLENATLGILPKHLWQGVDAEQFPFSELNVSPVGSGPYKIKKVERNSSGIPQGYVLSAFNDYALGRSYIDTLAFRFYPSEEALILAYQKGDVEAMGGVSPEKISQLKQVRIEQTPLPRIFAVFFNQNVAQIFSHSEVRAALNRALDKEQIVEQILANYGTAIDSPLPPESIDVENAALASSTETDSDTRIVEARALLEQGGWKFNEEEGVWTHPKKGKLQFSLATSEAPELKAVAEELKTAWEELGVPVEVKIFATGDLKETVVRPRKFDTLFFGQVLGRTSDPYPFWHSSQRLDPGLNIASYVNSSADKALEQARAESNPEKRAQFYETFKNEITKDVPAIFLYAPEFLYVVPKDVHGISLNGVTIPAERFSNIYEWYISTDNVWKIFAS
ncbi:MAG: Extracellular solute-binding protein family 5 [Parcubacteria group bacterium GW2011_GWA1_47_8]|nr:MAG: Extracellular solute-binding protein family 5 [Parcubacteria group bacterium GW2011_GWA1_47_8]